MQNQEELIGLLAKFCFSISGVATMRVETNRNIIRIQIVTEAIVRKRPVFTANLTRQISIMERELQSAYPRHKILIDIFVPSEGSSPEEMLGLPLEDLVSLEGVPKSKIN
jgi:hypothetical protein